MDYNTLLNIKVPLKLFYTILIFIFLLALIIISNLKYYETKDYEGIYQDNLIKINVYQKDLDTILNGTFIKINNQKYNYQIISLSEVIIDNNKNYQIISIQINDQFWPNEVLNIKAYAHKESIKEKILKYIGKEME